VDGEILKLRRQALVDRSDPWVRYRYRIACVRAGLPELAGVEAGDVVAVEEVESPWVRGPWRGEVLRVFDAGDKYVRPVGGPIPYRVRPSSEYLAKGLYLTREDRTTLVLPAQPRARGEREAA